MGTVGKSAHETQNRVIALFCSELEYRYLSDWTNHEGNSNIETALLATHLAVRDCRPAQISAAIRRLRG